MDFIDGFYKIKNLVLHELLELQNVGCSLTHTLEQQLVLTSS